MQAISLVSFQTHCAMPPKRPAGLQQHHIFHSLQHLLPITQHQWVATDRYLIGAGLLLAWFLIALNMSCHTWYLACTLLKMWYNGNKAILPVALFSIAVECDQTAANGFVPPIFSLAYIPMCTCWCKVNIMWTTHTMTNLTHKHKQQIKSTRDLTPHPLD